METIKRNDSIIHQRVPAMVSSNKSFTSTSSSSIISDSTNDSDCFNISFLTQNTHNYNRLLDDLSIIDNMYGSFGQESELNSYDKQVLDMARQVTYKHEVLNDLLQSERIYATNLIHFQKEFVVPFQSWLDTAEDRTIIAKFTQSPEKSDLGILLKTMNSLMHSHHEFLKALDDRIHLWGPTQLISDVFHQLLDSMKVYDAFLKDHTIFILTLDRLYKFPSFVKWLKTLRIHRSHPTTRIKIEDIIHYIQIPVNRSSTYVTALKQLCQYSDPSHPDYTSLTRVLQKFQSLCGSWDESIHDFHSHLMVTEAYYSIFNCPVQNTLNRRLLLSAHLTKVDLNDLSSMSDNRMYLLYNDHLIFCRRKKKRTQEEDGVHRKLVYKGSIPLRNAEIKLLSPTFLSKMTECKKTSFFRMNKRIQADTVSIASSVMSTTEAFGFELITMENELMNQPQMKKRHILRTTSLEEQYLWYETIRQCIQSVNATPL
ncbi:Dbl homology domain-containing protein [Pilobolus umbonatus]|nr:Dbl homology domain-containing protein [Pilobolus umbonatus]